jgi:hypothetical protein
VNHAFTTAKVMEYLLGISQDIDKKQLVKNVDLKASQSS